MNKLHKKLKNLLIFIFFKFYNLIFSKKHPFRIKNPNFLIVSTTGLGDNLWATFAFREIKRTYPKCSLSVLTNAIGNEIFKHNPYIDQLLFLKKSYFISFLKILFHLRRKKIQTVFLLHASQRMILPLCAAIKAEKIIGTSTLNKGLDFLLTDPVNLLVEHELNRREKILNKGKIRVTDFALELHLKKEEIEWGKKQFSHNKKDLIIGLHPGAKDHYKCWPKEYYVELAKALFEVFSCTLIFTGSKKELELMQYIQKEVPAAKYYTDVTIRQLASMINAYDYFITNDTGPLHLAIALNKKILAIFGPSNKNLSGPYQYSRAKIVEKNDLCPICIKKKCKNPFCLWQLSPEKVIAEAINDLEIIRKAKKDSSQSQKMIYK